MAKKVQIVALVEPDTAGRLNLLRLAMGESRARVIDIALTGGGLGRLEEACLADIKRVEKLARAAGVTPYAYADAYRIAYGRETYPLALDGLETDDSGVREHLTQRWG